MVRVRREVAQGRLHVVLVQRQAFVREAVRGRVAAVRRGGALLLLAAGFRRVFLAVRRGPGEPRLLVFVRPLFELLLVRLAALRRLALEAPGACVTAAYTC